MDNHKGAKIMAEQTVPAANVEDYDESTIKCGKIHIVVATLCDNIKQMQQVDKRFDYDFDLRLAKQKLTSLNNLNYPTNSEEKIDYVNDYRDLLTTGLRSLANFFDTFTDMELLSDEKRIKISSICANIVIGQESIMKIASS